MSQVGSSGKIINCNNFHVIALKESAESDSADSAKSIDGYSDF
jgi:hypothetical protein